MEHQLSTSTVSRHVHQVAERLEGELGDEQPSFLKNYGTLHPQVNALIGPHIQHLIDLTLTMNRVACEQDSTATGQAIGTNNNKREAI
ncbi:MAG TPA: hypothetical protein VKU38_00425 [Ktedonobacteraceae bacterium]|nr:hypothetical protein [Ktedonobacteraceae bacterium]